MRRIGLAILAALAASAPALAQDPDTSRRIRDIIITTRNVYDEETVQDAPLLKLFNKLHVPTKEEVILRELWFKPGDRVTIVKLAELERSLRGLGILGAATARFVDTEEDAEEADLHIETRDRFSLHVNASISVVGGVTQFSAGAGDINVLGSGKSVSARISRNDEREESGAVTYFDRQLLGSWHRMRVTAGETEEGHLANIDIWRPTKHLEDPFAHGVSFSSVDRDVDYFEAGDVVAEVPLLRNAAGAYVTRTFGPRKVRTNVGARFDFVDADYEPARGRDAALTRVPGDTQRFDLAATIATRWEDSYRKLKGIDAFDFTEDVILGAGLNMSVGFAVRDEDGISTQVQPTLSVGGHAAFEPLPETYVTIEARGAGRWYSGRTQGWSASGALHLFQTSLPHQTLAASLTFDGVFERQALRPQLTLGEDNGLRGYPAREFAGDRMVRLNLEDRIDTGLELASLHLGVAAFFDSGWIHNTRQGLSQNEAIKSAGFGLRIGSSELFGGNIGRVDFAWPLDDVNGESYSFSVSFSAGQVFSFFGNASELRREF